MHEIDDTIEQLQAGSADALARLTVMAFSPACTLEQLCRITSAIYTLLDDSHLQKSKMVKTLPVQQALCLSSLAPIVVKHYLCSQANNTIQPQVFPWTELHQWVLYLKNNFVDQESVDISFRIIAKKGIVEFLGVCEDTLLHHIFDRIFASSDIVAILFSLWHLEIQDARFSLSADPSLHPMFHLPSTLDSWMGAFSHREKWDWSEILRPFGGDPDTLAVTALAHLRQDAARVPINYNLIVWDIHLLTTLSINDAIRICLLNRHSMALVTSLVDSMVGRYGVTGENSTVATCISYGYWYISTYVESTEGLPWVAQTVEAGLLPAILSSEPWINHLEGPQSEDWQPLFLLLGEIIPKYSMYSSVLKPMIRQLTAIDVRNLPGKLQKGGSLAQTWSIFETVIRTRAALYNSVVGNEAHIESCQNVKCNKSGLPGSFKCCAGCFHVHYCSKECQVNDWKNGNHQRYCRDIQARRAAGLVSRLSKRDVHFIDRVIAQDLSFHRDYIQKAITVSNFNPVVVELNYTEFAVQIDVGSIDTMSEVDACQCDVPMTQKWNHMVELAQKSASKKILVRAFLPGGTFEKVKFQCLPVKRLLGDPNFTTDDETECDETLDLLYSRAG